MLRHAEKVLICTHSSCVDKSPRKQISTRKGYVGWSPLLKFLNGTAPSQLFSHHPSSALWLAFRKIKPLNQLLVTINKESNHNCSNGSQEKERIPVPAVQQTYQLIYKELKTTSWHSTFSCEKGSSRHRNQLQDAQPTPKGTGNIKIQSYTCLFQFSFSSVNSQMPWSTQSRSSSLKHPCKQLRSSQMSYSASSRRRTRLSSCLKKIGRLESPQNTSRQINIFTATFSQLD